MLKSKTCPCLYAYMTEKWLILTLNVQQGTSTENKLSEGFIYRNVNNCVTIGYQTISIFFAVFFTEEHVAHVL